ncbi:Cell surface protein [Acidisarcina polymorpha]|uniref:Cell surface protein n=1 Tax=Acidisarcina polymorpha TaxID=2211140 RepID=A0A2Z5G2A5_9BACT|nr:SBBP repeat-containing protein [Acidisarcina polymorpha]AXC13323.1 Cell surface protein [Acidisarcina polymorpha]
MRSIPFKALILIAVDVLAFGQVAASAQTASSSALNSQPTTNSKLAAVNPAVKANFAKLPLSFEANQGQTDGQVKFLSRGQGYSLFLTDREAVLALHKNEAQPVHGRGGKPAFPAQAGKIDVVRMELDGASQGVRVAGEEPLPGKSNYFIGSDPSKWHTNVPTYSKVKYNNVYPGIDLVYYGSQQQLEYDFVVARNADPKQARLRFTGASKLKLNHDGDLEIVARDGEIAFHKPVAYQMKDGQRQPVEGRFQLLTKNTVGFAVKDYDHSRELVIDPVLGYSTYLSGSGSTGYTEGLAIAVDNSGQAVVTGFTNSTTFPVTSGAYQPTLEEFAQDAFVTKLNSTGTALIYSTFLGGSSGATGSAIALDSAGDAYVGGSAFSGYPTTPGAFQTTYHCVPSAYCSIGFVTELNPQGSALVFSTYLGGSGRNGGYGDAVLGLALDVNKNIYATGYTASLDFPVTSGAFQTTNKAPTDHPYNAFLSKLNAGGAHLVYSTYLGGSGYTGEYRVSGDRGLSVGVDGSGFAYVGGLTISPDFPTTSGTLQTVYYGGDFGTGFVSKFNADGSSLLYSTYISGTRYPTRTDAGDVVNAIAVDSSGDAYITGSTVSLNFPVTANAFQKVKNSFGASISFVSKINPKGTGFVYSTYLGSLYNVGDIDDQGNGIAVDANGEATVTGATFDEYFPVTPDAFQPQNHSYSNSFAANAFLTRLNRDGSALIYSTYLGGHYEASGSAVALDSADNAYLTGITSGGAFPVSVGAFQPKYSGNHDYYNAFVSEIYFGTLPAPVATTTTLSTSANTVQKGVPVTLTAHVTLADGTAVTRGGVNLFLNGNGQYFDTVDLDSAGNAIFTTSTISPGTYKISAEYVNNSNELPNYGPSASPSLSLTVLSQVAPPVFTPAGGNGNNPVEQVSLSSATVGASIHYTINGGTPTPSSMLFNSYNPITVVGTIKIQAIAVYNGTSSAVASATYTSPTYPTTPIINFSQGFPLTAGVVTTNGSASLFEGYLNLTTDGYDQAGSSFYATPVNVQSFTTDFSFHILEGGISGAGGADGFTFTIQNAGPNALGGDGAGLGFVTIQKSLAIKFDIYNNVGEGPDSTGLYIWGRTPTVPAINLSGTGINLASNDIYDAHLTYDGAILNMTITNLYTRASFSYAWEINIPSTVGGPTAYVGFTGSTGGETSFSSLDSWTYESGSPAAPNFATGFEDGNGVYLNGTAVPSGSAVQLTTGLKNQAGSLFFPNALNIQSFTSKFGFQITDPSADGLTFTIQGVGPTALGGTGGGLGYNTIPKSVALKFDLFNNAGEGVNSTGIYTGGTTPTLPSVDLTGTGIDLHSGDPITVDLSYNGTVLTMTITDQITKAHYTHPFTVDIPAAVGGTTAFVGFTGATGGETSKQGILTWTFTPGS